MRQKSTTLRKQQKAKPRPTYRVVGSDERDPVTVVPTPRLILQAYFRVRVGLQRVLADAEPVAGCAALMATVGETVEHLLKQHQETGESAFALLQEVVQRLERHRAAAVDTKH